MRARGWTLVLVLAAGCDKSTLAWHPEAGAETGSIVDTGGEAAFGPVDAGAFLRDSAQDGVADTGAAVTVDAAPVTDVAVSTPDAAVGLCRGNYAACGCGCCSTLPSLENGAKPRCYYPELGQTLDSVMTEDLAIRGTEACVGVACVPGTFYMCCVAAPVTQPSEASYTATGYIGGYDRLFLSRRQGDTCATITLVQPSSLTDTTFQVSAPATWRGGYSS